MGTDIFVDEESSSSCGRQRVEVGLNPRSPPCEIVLANIRSLLNKRDELEYFVMSSRPAAIALTETWLSADVSDAEINIAGYTVLRCDRKGRIGGGTILYVREDISANVIHTSADPAGEYDGLWCKVKFSPGGYDIV